MVTDRDRVIPRSLLLKCEHHELEAAEFFLLDRHLTPNRSRCLEQIVSSR